MIARRLVISCLLTVLACGGPRLAWSNGDGFFESKEIPGNPQFVIFGSVKDERGKHLSKAIVTVSIAEHMLEFATETDVIGRFRSADIGRAITDLGYEVDPSLISITVEYPGHSVLRREYRGKYRQNKGAVEVNFRMKMRPN